MTDQTSDPNSAVQITFNGEPVDDPREKPDTFLWCNEEKTYVLRSLKAEWPYELYDSRDAAPSESEVDNSTVTTDDDGNGDEEDEPREVGGVFTVSLAYDVTYNKKIIAADKDQAVKLAKEELDFRDDCPVDATHLHDDAIKRETLTEDDDRCDEMPGWPW